MDSSRRFLPTLSVILLAFAAITAGTAQAEERIRLVIETDAGGDPDDEQSLVRFLLYANEWDVIGIIANRPTARTGENLNPQRTGLGVVRRLLKAYEACYPNLASHDSRYPTPDQLWTRTVAGYNDTEDGKQLLLQAVDGNDPRPLWYSDWGTDHGSATNNLRRALDHVLATRGQEGYVKFKSRLRLSSADKFASHSFEIDPPFPLWVDTWRPTIDRRRWYHQFSRIVGKAGGFDLMRDCIIGHGPLGALYPTNTTHWQKEGDSLSFIYLIPTGLGEPENPTLGGWGGRQGVREDHPDRPYYWANQADTWKGVTHRDQTLVRWAEAIQNDFKARLDWCVKPFDEANHPPVVSLAESPLRTLHPGEQLALTVLANDPDDDVLRYDWQHYVEPGSYPATVKLENRYSDTATIVAPDVEERATLHFVVTVTDSGEPALSRYARVIITVEPGDEPAF